MMAAPRDPPRALPISQVPQRFCVLLPAPLFQGSPDPTGTVCTTLTEGDQSIYCRGTSCLGGQTQCRDWDDTRGEEGMWVGDPLDCLIGKTEIPGHWGGFGWYWGRQFAWEAAGLGTWGCSGGAGEEQVPSAGLSSLWVAMSRRQVTTGLGKDALCGGIVNDSRSGAGHPQPYTGHVDRRDP